MSENVPLPTKHIFIEIWINLKHKSYPWPTKIDAFERKYACVNALLMRVHCNRGGDSAKLYLLNYIGLKKPLIANFKTNLKVSLNNDIWGN